MVARSMPFDCSVKDFVLAFMFTILSVGPENEILPGHTVASEALIVLQSTAFVPVRAEMIFGAPNKIPIPKVMPITKAIENLPVKKPKPTATIAKIATALPILPPASSKTLHKPLEIGL